ncbi:MAG TPA: DUF542 domain-containing protein [Thermoanaerobaculia bacterium]|jgi:regulator of cell morphogenesis and NO signaling
MHDEVLTIADFAISRPGAIATLESLGIDFCCKGGQTVEEACRPTGITAGELFAMTERIQTKVSRDWRCETMSATIRFIVDAHHVYTRDTLGALAPLAMKVRERHGGTREELRVVERLVGELASELVPHMLKEEQILFPYIDAVEQASVAGNEPPVPFFGTARNPIQKMMLEHESAAEILRELRLVTGDYALPPSACASYAALYSQLSALESDLHRHIHIENNILFPRAIETEEKTRRTPVDQVLLAHSCGHD